MSIKRPVNDKVDAHFFSKEGATHADDKRYLLSSKGQSSRLPLAKGCGNFNGVDNYVEIPPSDDLTFGDGVNDQPFSITGWVYMIDSTKFRILSKTSAGTSNAEYVLATSSVDLLQFGLYDLTTSSFLFIETTTLAIYQNSWIYIACTYDGSQNHQGLEIYVYDVNDNLLEVKNGGSNPGGYVAMHNLSIPIDIGRRSLTSTDYSNGRVYDVRVHNVELTATQIEDVRNFKPSGAEVGQWAIEEKAGATSYDSTPNGNHGTINGDLTNFWYEDASVPHNFANENGFSTLDIP